MDSCPSGSGASRDVEKAEHPLLIIVNKEGNTVLHEALINRCKQEEVVEVLIKADPQVAYYPNKEGKSPLYLAAEAHYFHVVEAIVKFKVEEHMNINRDREAKPAVHGAILGKNKGMTCPFLNLHLILLLFFFFFKLEKTPFPMILRRKRFKLATSSFPIR